MLIETVPPTWRFMGRTPRILNWPAVYDEGMTRDSSWLRVSGLQGLENGVWIVSSPLGSPNILVV